MIDDHAKMITHRNRDRRLRRHMLQALYATRGNSAGGWMTARFVADVVTDYAPPAERPTSDEHVATLLRDLVLKRFAEERDDRNYKWQSAGLDYTSLRITSAGVSLIEQSATPDPDIEDDRLV